MKINLKLYFAYLKNPVYLKNEKIRWPAFFKLLVIAYLLFILLNIFPVILSSLLHLQGLPHYFKRIGLLKLWKGALLVPIFEETLFRFLLKPTRKNIFWYTIILTIPLVANLIKGRHHYAFAIAFMAVMPLVLLLKQSYLKKVQKYFLKHFRLFFYLSFLIFGLVHVTNFSPFGYTVLLLAPLLTLPQLFAGTVLGFVRMKYGIVYSILFHFLINLPAFILFR